MSETSKPEVVPTQENTTEQKPVRSKTECLEEYKQVAALVGDKVYRSKLLEVELDQLYKKMYEINAEHMALVAKEVPPPTLVPAPETV